MHRISISTGETLYREGEPGATAFLVLSGEISMRRNGVDLAVGKGSVIGLSGVIDRPYGSTATAASACALLAFTRKELRSLIRSDPDQAMVIIDAIIDLLGQVNQAADHLASGPIASAMRLPESK